ncbi:hypothetical protein EVAR_50103_1 [Eumeta japonica]|uniref:Uncharacterized protein n=1 Tax=Eumeta variegata TaxID=151549 RepID=A0A4C1XVS7_EUMVA|nr:hypothetical protein EVAR_50103_1 [Eumeta japonica]
MRRYNAPQPILLLPRIPVLRDRDAFVTNFTAVEFRTLYSTGTRAASIRACKGTTKARTDNTHMLHTTFAWFRHSIVAWPQLGPSSMSSDSLSSETPAKTPTWPGHGERKLRGAYEIDFIIHNKKN